MVNVFVVVQEASKKDVAIIERKERVFIVFNFLFRCLKLQF